MKRARIGVDQIVQRVVWRRTVPIWLYYFGGDSRMKQRIALVFCALAAFCLPTHAQRFESQRAAINGVMPALHFGPTAQAISVTMMGGAVYVDFSRATADGLTDEGIERLTDAARIAFEGVEGITDWYFTCDGRLLASYLPPPPMIPRAEGSRARGPLTLTAGPLTGKKIAISPGHGWYWYESGPYWTYERGVYWGIGEDTLNPEMMQYVYNILVNNGATVYPCRELDKTYGQCTTNFTFASETRTNPNKPWWHMAGLYYAARQGAPSSVYDNGRTTDYNRDIAVRPYYANWRGADIMVSLHNNGDSGTSSGTLTMYDNHNGYSVTDATNQYGSQYLGQKVHARVVSEIRANYNSSWVSAGAQGFAGSYGENNYFNGPACIVEVAFMDTLSPDNNALHDENFKMLVAKAIYEGICDYFHVTPGYNTNVAAPSGAWTATPLTKAWAVKLGSPINSAPSSSGGWVYVGTDGGLVYGIPATSASGATPGTIGWKYPASGSLGAAVKARPTVYNDRVYAVALNGKMVCLDRVSGALQWSTTVPNSGNLVSSPAPTADGTLVMGSDNGHLYAYSQATGALLRTFPTAFGAINSQVSMPDYGHVWVTSADGKIRCVSGDLLTILWERNTNAAISTAPFVLTTNNSVFVTNTAKTVVALNASNGGTATGWPAAGVTMAFNIGTSPWADGTSGVVAFGMDNHSISALDVASGVVPSDFPLKPYGVKEFTSTPVVLNGTVYVGGTDGRLYALKRSTGATNPGTAWRAYTVDGEALPGNFNASPCLTGSSNGDVVVAGNTNGWLYAFPI